MQTLLEVPARRAAPKKPAKKSTIKTPAAKRGSKRTEEFLAAVMGIKFR